MPQIGSNVRAAAMHNIVVRTSAYTAIPGDFILANALTTGFTITLPSNPPVGTVVGVKKTDASLNIVTVVGQNNSLIDGDAGATMHSRGAGADFVWDGTNWWTAGIFNESSTPAVPILGRKNAIRNGDFSVWQRGKGTFYANPSGAYGPDGWILHSNNTGSNIVRWDGFTIPDIKDFAILVSAGQTGIAADHAVIEARIENVGRFAGKTVTISFDCSCSTGSGDIAVEVAQYFGAGGSPSPTVHTFAGKVAIDTVMTRKSVTVTIPSVVGKTLGTDGKDYLSIFLWTSAGSTYAARTNNLGTKNWNVNFSKVQMEEGAVATPFEVLPEAEQLAWNQRYFEAIRVKGYAPALWDTGWANYSVYRQVYYKVQKRTIPAITIFSITSIDNMSAAGSIDAAHVTTESFVHTSPRAQSQFGYNAIDAVFYASAEL